MGVWDSRQLSGDLVSAEGDRLLRQTAARRGQSLNQIIVNELAGSTPGSATA